MPYLPIALIPTNIYSQNYTCTSSGTYTSVGAIAKLYDVSCLATNPILEYLPELIYQFANQEPIGYSIFPNIDILEPTMHHFFVNNNAGGLSPRFNLDPTGKLLAYSTLKKAQVSSFLCFRLQQVPHALVEGCDLPHR